MATVMCNFCKKQVNSGALQLKDRDDEGYPKIKCTACAQ